MIFVVFFSLCQGSLLTEVMQNSGLSKQSSMTEVHNRNGNIYISLFKPVKRVLEEITNFWSIIYRFCSKSQEVVLNLEVMRVMGYTTRSSLRMHPLT